MRVTDKDGTPSPATTVEHSRGEIRHSQPSWLPDGRWFLFAAYTGDKSFISVGDRVSANSERILEAGRTPRYTAGHLVFVRGQALLALPFDASTRQSTGAIKTVTDRFQAASFSVSDSGMIVSGNSGHRELAQLTWYGPDGTRRDVVGEPSEITQVALSPTNSRVAIQKLDEHDNADIWTVDLTNGNQSRLTGGPRPVGGAGLTATDPVWSSDERFVAFSVTGTGTARVMVKDLATGEESSLADYPHRYVVDDWVAHGGLLLCRSFGEWRVLAGTMERGEWRRLADMAGSIWDQQQVSPNGRWVAFNASEAGGDNVYVARFPEYADLRNVSPEGASSPAGARTVGNSSSSPRMGR